MIELTRVLLHEVESMCPIHHDQHISLAGNRCIGVDCHSATAFPLYVKDFRLQERHWLSKACQCGLQAASTTGLVEDGEDPVSLAWTPSKDL